MIAAIDFGLIDEVRELAMDMGLSEPFSSDDVASLLGYEHKKMPQQVVGCILGIKQVRVHQLEKSAFEKLRRGVSRNPDLARVVSEMFETDERECACKTPEDSCIVCQLNGEFETRVGDGQGLLF